MKKTFFSLLVLFGMSGHSVASVPVGLGTTQAQPVASMRVNVTEETFDDVVDAAFEQLETQLDAAGADYSGMTFFRSYDEDEVEPYVLEVGYLLSAYPASLPLSLRGSLPGGLVLHATATGEDVDTDEIYLEMENFMVGRHLDSRETPFEIYAAEEEDWTRVVWPVSHHGHPAPIPAP